METRTYRTKRSRKDNFTEYSTKQTTLSRASNPSARICLFPQQTKDKERLTYYVLNDITDFEIWEIERAQLMQTDPEILWREFSTLSGREDKSPTGTFICG